MLNTVKCTAWGNAIQQLQVLHSSSSTVVKVISYIPSTWCSTYLCIKICPIVNIFNFWEVYWMASLTNVYISVLAMASSCLQQKETMWFVYMPKISVNFKQLSNRICSFHSSNWYTLYLLYTYYFLQQWEQSFKFYRTFMIGLNNACHIN